MPAIVVDAFEISYGNCMKPTSLRHNVTLIMTSQNRQRAHMLVLSFVRAPLDYKQHNRAITKVKVIFEMSCLIQCLRTVDALLGIYIQRSH